MNPNYNNNMCDPTGQWVNNGGYADSSFPASNALRSNTPQMHTPVPTMMDNVANPPGCFYAYGFNQAEMTPQTLVFAQQAQSPTIGFQNFGEQCKKRKKEWKKEKQKE